MAGVASLVLLLPSVGCNSAQSGSAGSALTWTSSNVDAVPGIDKGSVHITRSSALPLTFVIWTDVDGGSSKGSSGDGFHELAIQSSEGSRLKIHCDMADAEAATMTIDGREHNLADGALFLISTVDSKVRVLQLDYDLENFPTTQSALKEYAETNEEIREFFGGKEIANRER
jgi:hypothetical protein